MILIQTAAGVLSLLTLFLYFREQFITGLLWVLGITLVLQIVIGTSRLDEDEYVVFLWVIRIPRRW